MNAFTNDNIVCFIILGKDSARTTSKNTLKKKKKRKRALSVKWTPSWHILCFPQSCRIYIKCFQISFRFSLYRIYIPRKHFLPALCMLTFTRQNTRRSYRRNKRCELQEKRRKSLTKHYENRNYRNHRRGLACQNETLSKWNALWNIVSSWAEKASGSFDMMKLIIVNSAISELTSLLNESARVTPR